MGKPEMGMEEALKNSSENLETKTKTENPENKNERMERGEMKMDLERLGEVIETLNNTKSHLEQAMKDDKTPPNWDEVHEIIDKIYFSRPTQAEKYIQGYVRKGGRVTQWVKPEEQQ